MLQMWAEMALLCRHAFRGISHQRLSFIEIKMKFLLHKKGENCNNAPYYIPSRITYEFKPHNVVTKYLKIVSNEWPNFWCIWWYLLHHKIRFRIQLFFLALSWNHILFHFPFPMLLKNLCKLYPVGLKNAKL